MIPPAARNGLAVKNAPHHKRDDRPRRERERDEWKRELPRERKERVADPNSPFAALAALKARLEAGKKDD